MSRSARRSRSSRATSSTGSRASRRGHAPASPPATRAGSRSKRSSTPTRGSARTPGGGLSRSARAARRRRRRIRTAVTTSAAAVILLAGVTGAWALLRDEDSPAPAQTTAAVSSTTTTTTTPPPTTPPPPPQAVVATTAVSEISVFESPSDAAPVKTTLSDRTEYGVVRTLLVTNQDTPGWLEVLLPLKPNGQSGWIHDSDVTRTLVPYEIHVDRATHTLRLFNLGQLVLETPVAVGTPGTPTPTGLFYITDPVPSYEGSSYGPYALGISGYSDVLTQFAGGPPQIAIHGTNHPELIGQDVSNGCVRVPNDMILQIKDQVPLGTPVIIT